MMPKRIWVWVIGWFALSIVIGLILDSAFPWKYYDGGEEYTEWIIASMIISFVFTYLLYHRIENKRWELQILCVVPFWAGAYFFVYAVDSRFHFRAVLWELISGAIYCVPLIVLAFFLSFKCWPRKEGANAKIDALNTKVSEARGVDTRSKKTPDDLVTVQWESERERLERYRHGKDSIDDFEPPSRIRQEHHEREPTNPLPDSIAEAQKKERLEGSRRLAEITDMDDWV
ncbi:MAG: hypothetical protein HYU64_03200 [Armatimonadetes bacterium]|nr:hypothetical protein [Armatimonadota bacterium]